MTDDGKEKKRRDIVGATGLIRESFHYSPHTGVTPALRNVNLGRRRVYAEETKAQAVIDDGHAFTIPRTPGATRFYGIYVRYRETPKPVTIDTLLELVVEDINAESFIQLGRFIRSKMPPSGILDVTKYDQYKDAVATVRYPNHSCVSSETQDLISSAAGIFLLMAHPFCKTVTARCYDTPAV